MRSLDMHASHSSCSRGSRSRSSKYLRFCIIPFNFQKRYRRAWYGGRLGACAVRSRELVASIALPPILTSFIIAHRKNSLDPVPTPAVPRHGDTLLSARSALLPAPTHHSRLAETFSNIRAPMTRELQIPLHLPCASQYFRRSKEPRHERPDSVAGYDGDNRMILFRSS